MYDYLLGFISCVCMFHFGLSDEICDQTILAKRQVMYVPAGDAVSLSCVVRHCGLNWTGTWLWKNSTDEHFTTVEETERRHLIKVTLSADEAQVTLKILRVNQMDEGSYGCSVTWGTGNTDSGHWMYVNVTAAVVSQRDLSHRIVICAGAFLCLPIILGLTHCLSSGIKHQPLPKTEFIYAFVKTDESQNAPQPPPRRSVPQERNSSFHQGPPRTHQKPELVYADISQDALQRQGEARDPVQSTVYSLMTFP